MSNTSAQYQVVSPPPDMYAASVGGASPAVALGHLRRGLLQQQRLTALAVAAGKLGRPVLANATRGILAQAPAEIARWVTAPGTGAWIQAVILALDPNTPRDAVLALARSFGVETSDLLEALVLRADAIKREHDDERTRRHRGERSSLVEIDSLSATISLPGVDRYPTISPRRLAELQPAFMTAQELIARHLPWLDADRHEFVPRMVPVTMKQGRLLSATNSELLGVIFVTEHQDPGLLAEQMVHEISHTRLFLLQMLDDLIDEQYPNSSWTDAKYYSPWRRDPRPLNGILHGAFVFDAVAEFWTNVLAGGAVSPQTAAHGRRRLGQVIGQLEQARRSLERDASLTAVGQAVQERLSQRLATRFLPLWERERLADEPVLDLDGIMTEPTVTVGQHLRQHEEQWQESHG